MPFDNLTRISLTNNVIRDFTFEGVLLQTFGDAQMLANIQANQILNNGPGLDDDPDGDGIFEGPNSNAVVPTEFGFHDGLEIIASGTSTISARVDNNAFINNFEQGVAIQTLGSARINMVMNSNRLSNDIGGDNTNPAGVVLGQDVFDMFVANSATGDICLGLSNNTFRLPIGFAGDLPGIDVGLDGATNGFTAGDLTAANPGLSLVGFGVCDAVITAEELFFQANGF